MSELDDIRRQIGSGHYNAEMLLKQTQRIATEQEAELTQLRTERDEWKRVADGLQTDYGAIEYERDQLRTERDRLHSELSKAVPEVSRWLRHLRAKNDMHSLALTNDFADMRAALTQREGGENDDR